MDEYLKFLSGKTVFVTGGTGSFGKIMVSVLAKTGVRKIIVFSRDEEKQSSMRFEFSDPRIKFIIGDVRDYGRLLESIPRETDLLYHAAALKQVPFCEEHPYEAFSTNVIGAHNVKRAALEKRVRLCIAISTDKAVKPVNVMGMTKALQERIFSRASVEHKETGFVCVRYGNVIGSRGSVVPLFKNLLAANKPLRVTHPEMTRFWLTLPEAVSLIFTASKYARSGEILVKKLPACFVVDLARTMMALNNTETTIEFTGVRPGEKIHETLVSEEEMVRTRDSDGVFVIQPKACNGSNLAGVEYRSDTARRMLPEEIKKMLSDGGWS